MALFLDATMDNLDDTQVGVNNRNGALFMMIAINAFNAYESVALTFPDEKPVFLREVNNNMYKVSSFYASRLLAEMPAAFLIPSLLAVITYWCIDLSTEHWYTFFVHLGVQILVYLHSNSLATICATLIPDKKLVLLTIPFVNLPLFLFSGFFINRHQVTIWLAPIQYISYYKYGYQALLLNEYDDQDLLCMHETDPAL
jgi:ATP-binding cassette, subfamily G (WHITE), eye pigment precursor transporter